MENSMNGYINETVMMTPTPTAFSTETKKQTKNADYQKAPKKMIQFSEESLGILSLSNTFELGTPRAAEFSLQTNSQLANHSLDQTAQMDNLIKSRELAKAALSKCIKNSSTNSRKNYTYEPSSTESTVNETDFLKGVKSYLPERMHAGSSLHLAQMKALDKMIPEMLNMEKSVKQIIEESVVMLKPENMCNSTTIEEFDSGMFMPAELATKKLMDDEQSWRKKHNMPRKETSTFSIGETSQDEKCSIGDLFAAKSNECSSIFHKKSPERRTPVALIESGMDRLSLSNISNITDSSLSQLNRKDESILSLSKIRHFISNEEDDTPNKIIDRLIGDKKAKPVKHKEQKRVSLNFNENLSTLNSNTTNSCDYFKKPYFSTSNLFSNATDDDVLRNTNLMKTQSLESISNKENIADTNIDKSLSSMKSSSSISTLPDGKLAIECTKLELIWGCVKLGKSESINLTIRNKFQQKLRFQVLSTNPNFKISKVDTDILSEVSVLLYPMESRQFTIIFTPSSLGAHIGKLQFNPIIKGIPEKNSQQKLKMFGYGGHSTISFDRTSNIGNKHHLLSLGSIENKSILTTAFVIKNTGTLPGFATIAVLPKAINNFKDIKVTPSDVSIGAGEKVVVNITYTPTKQDYTFITTSKSASNVHRIAELKVVTGSDITRARLRRLHNLIKRNNLSVDSLIQQLSLAYKNENMPKDVKLFTESVAASAELLQHSIQSEIELTVEYDNDRTLVPGMSLYETSMFQTLKHAGCDMTENEHMLNESKREGIKVLPNNLILTPPHKLTDTVLLVSECSTEMCYDIKMEPEGIIGVNHRRGIINCGETLMLNISCPKIPVSKKVDVKMFIHTDVGILDVSISIINVN